MLLITDLAGAERAALQAHARAEGATELMVPKTILSVDKVPVLGTGKTDYVAAKALAEQALAPAASSAA